MARAISKRAIERFLVYPLSNLVATGQVGLGDLLLVDYSSEIGKLVFSKETGGALVTDDEMENIYPGHFGEESSGSAAAIASPELHPVPARQKRP